MHTTSKSEQTDSKIANLVDFTTRRHNLFYQKKNGRKFMILPIPGRITSYQKETKPFGNFLNDIDKNLTPVYLGKKNEITVLQNGQDTVLKFNRINPEEIIRAISKLDESIRPSIKNELIEFHSNFYRPEWQLIIVCFDNKQEIAQPLWIEYDPFDFNKVFFPGADSHDGEPPMIGKPVNRDLTLIFGTYSDNSVGNVNFGPEFKGPKVISDAKWKLIHDERFMMNMTTNGDWWGTIDPKTQKLTSFLLNTKKEYNDFKNMPKL